MSAARTIKPAAELPWDVIGTALDYRIRYYFRLAPTAELVAFRGACEMAGCPEAEDLADLSRLVAKRPPSPSGELNYLGRLALNFFASLETVLQQLKPAGRRLERDKEELLGRYCVALAYFEQFFRATLRSLMASPLLYPTPRRTVEEVLTLAQDSWLDDLCALSWTFYECCRELIGRPVILNPTFQGSEDVGGADADLIVDGCLIDIKTTTRVEIRSVWLWQLLGYALLDYSNEYGIRAVGLYLARQGLLLRWPLRELMALLSGRRQNVAKLRQELRQTINPDEKARQLLRRLRQVSGNPPEITYEESWDLRDLVCTPREAAQLFGVSPSTVRRWRRAGRLRPLAYLPGGFPLYDRAGIERLGRGVSIRFKLPRSTNLKFPTQR